MREVRQITVTHFGASCLRRNLQDYCRDFEREWSACKRDIRPPVPEKNAALSIVWGSSELMDRELRRQLLKLVYICTYSNILQLV